MQTKNILFVLLIGSALALPVYGQGNPRQMLTAAAPAIPAECNMVNISVSFNFEGNTSSAAKNELDDRLFKLNGYLRQNYIDRLETQSICYKITFDPGTNNVRRQPNQKTEVTSTPPVYRLTGTAEYQIDSSDNAFKIGQFLTQQKFQVTVSNKPTKNLQCNQPSPVPVPSVAPVVKPNPPAAKPSKPADKTNNDVSNILNEKPPAEDKTPATISGPAPYVPPSMYQDPPDAVPLPDKR